MLRCPRCQSREIYRTPTHSTWALLRRRITAKRPHICESCGWRGWGEETGPKFTDEEIRLATRAFDESLDVRSQLDDLALPGEFRVASTTFELPAEIAADAGRPEPNVVLSYEPDELALPRRRS